MNRAIRLLQHTPVTRRIIRTCARWRSHSLVRSIERHVTPGERILDIGSGPCAIVAMLRERGHNVTPLDIVDLSFEDGITAQLYPGDRIPFDDDSFDTALLITVLHHTPDPDAILREARRVARRIVIIEDIFTTSFGKYTTFIADSILNLEFFGHPRANRSDMAWRETFNRLGLTLTSSHRRRALFAFLHGTYCVARADYPAEVLSHSDV